MNDNIKELTEPEYLEDMSMKTTRRKPKYDKARYENFEIPTDDMDVDIQNYSSKLISTRKDTKCVYCGAEIKCGDYALAEKGFLDGEPFYVHNCLDCVEETMDMQDGVIDTDDALERWGRRAKKSGVYINTPDEIEKFEDENV